MKLIIAFVVSFFLIGCDDRNREVINGDVIRVPGYVSDARDDLRSAIVANIFQTVEFKCHALEIDNQWTIGCFKPDPRPAPFLLFSVNQKGKAESGGLGYGLVALNGKAKQYAENSSMSLFGIDTSFNTEMNIGDAINKYVAAFPE
ncbi:hypothetical protein [Enterobacter asburiae]|uniref:hypothetical protein n=1 Tax=Enterobacter asburiae TaxID=61645 RepID=UPI00192A83D2|nr:hypothetical protein [Enterobacter asburiae]MBL5911224.1 hypothetical protein [Enterobacter asburiae]